MNWADHASILRCPISGSSLTPLSRDEIEAVNAQIALRQRVSAGDADVSKPLGVEALGTEDRRFVYRIDGPIACLLPALAHVSKADADHALDGDKRGVKEFYDTFGWLDAADGVTQDAAAFTETNPTARAYLRRCNGRVESQLRGGTYLLDAASGFVGDAYERLSRGYRFRVCVDLSVLALRRTHERLGDQVLCILGDVTCLPIATGAMDDAISLHTIYHVPVDQQTQAVGEVARTVRSGGRAVIVYVWREAPLMVIASTVTISLGALRGRQRSRRRTSQTSAAEAPPLYFHPQGREWWRDLRRKFGARLRLWSAVDAKFQRAFFRDSGGGRCASEIIYGLESVLEPICARFGQYPMFVIRVPNGQITHSAD